MQNENYTTGFYVKAGRIVYIIKKSKYFGNCRYLF